MKLGNKVVLITGSSSGIGREIAMLFARKGAKVVVTYNKNKHEGEVTLEECLKKSEAILVKLDVTNEKSIADAVEKTMKEFKKIDILVNNAGVVYVKNFHQQSFKEIQEQIDINLIGAMKMTSMALPHLEDEKDAFIINVASTAGKEAEGELAPYCASKFGLRGFTQALATELPESIKIFSINPGLTATNMTNFKGLEPRLVADVIAQVIEGKIQKVSGSDVDVDDYYEGNKKKLPQEDRSNEEGDGEGDEDAEEGGMSPDDESEGDEQSGKGMTYVD